MYSIQKSLFVLLNKYFQNPTAEGYIHPMRFLHSDSSTSTILLERRFSYDFVTK